MTTNNWLTNGVGNWTTSADWSLGTPTTSQDVFIGISPNADVFVSGNTFVHSIGIGFNDVLQVSGVFTANAGTGTPGTVEQSIAAGGKIAVGNGASFVVGGNVNNAGTIWLVSGGILSTATNSSVAFKGGGVIEMGTLGGSQDFLTATAGATIVNFNDDIAGTGTISGGTFQNGGIIETNSSDFGAGTLTISYTGNFSNARHGLMRVDAGGTMVLGTAGTMVNRGIIELLATGAGNDATLEIAGNIAIDNTGGTIQLDGGFSNRVESNGSAASLTVNGGTIEGNGYFGNGDSHFTLIIGSGAIINSNNGHALFLDTAGNTITNHGVMEATSGSGLAIDSPLISDGVILAANGGGITLGNNATGTVTIGSGGQLGMASNTLTGDVLFTGTGAKLSVDAGSNITGRIIGATPGDTIDFAEQTFAATDKVVWQQNGGIGTLSLETSTGTVLQTLTLAGQYAAADFTAPEHDDFHGIKIDLVAAPVTVQTASGIDLRWATLYDELANSTIATGATATQYTAVDNGHFNGHSANILFVVSGTGLTYSGSVPNVQLTGGTITGIQVEDLSNTVLATFASLSIPAATLQSAVNSYIAGGSSPNASALNAIFLPLIYETAGGTGSDKLQGGSSSNVFDASTGNDTLSGGTGTAINTADYSSLASLGLVAIVQGGGGTVNKGGANGSDTLTSVRNLIDTGTGRSNGDVFYVDSSETVTANSGNFNYLIELTANANLVYGTNFTGISEFVSNTGTNILDFSLDPNFAYVYGSTSFDTLSLGSGGGYLFGEGGSNALYGGQNAANFFVGGGGGSDNMYGGTGTATNFYFVDSNDQVFGAGAFNTMIELVAGVSVQISGNGQYQHVQEFVANGGTNNLSVANNDSDFIYLYGGSGNDTLQTGSGGGYLIGEGGTNTLIGGGGLNVLVADGGSGVDTMNGGSGSNIYYIDNNSIVHGGGTFNNVIELQQNASLTLGSAQLGTDVQQVIFNGGTNSADFHTATTSVFLYGGANNDTLFGGSGNDFLYGGLGTNTFKFATGWGQDTIEDWTAGTNSIIDLTLLASSGVHALSDLTQTISGGKDVITSSHTGTNSITLLGVSSALAASSFHFN